VNPFFLEVQPGSSCLSRAEVIFFFPIDNGNNFCYNLFGCIVTEDKRGFLLQIKQTLPSLPEQERKVADYVLRHPYEVVGYSITRLADLCGVSSTTVSRFCQRLGLPGYRRFKIALAREWRSPEQLTYVDLQPGDTLASVANKIFAADVQALRDTQKVLDMAVLEQVVDAILGARRVDIYAMGGASIPARELHLKCMHQGMNANAFLDAQMQIMSAASLTAEDVGIGISHSGMQSQVAEALTLAGEGGATTVALTSYPHSPVAKAASLVLYTASLAADTTYDSPSVRNAQLAVVDVIYAAMVWRGKELTRDRMARVARAIANHTTGAHRGS
jgi:DNA-binding MurR/RpiR family transcriptional regulator